MVVLTVRRFPHLLQIELFDSVLIWSDGGTFDADFVLLDGFSRIDSNWKMFGGDQSKQLVFINLAKMYSNSLP